MDMSPKALRAEFNKVGAEIEKIMAKAAPFREERDKLVAEFTAKEAKLKAKILSIEEGLFDKRNAHGALVRALGGKTGEPQAEDESQEPIVVDEPAAK